MLKAIVALLFPIFAVAGPFPLFMDSDQQYLGNSPGDDNRGRLHVLIANKLTEGIPISITGTGGLATEATLLQVRNNQTNGTQVTTANQGGVWSVGRTWLLASGSDSIDAVQSGPWAVSVNNFPAIQPVSQSGTWTVEQGAPPWLVAQSGAWTTGRTWTLSNSTDSVAAVQSGSWTVLQGSPPWSVSQSGVWNINDITGTISLPTGASTSALQTTGNTSLASIDNKMTDGTQRTQLTDGTNNVGVSNAPPASTAYGLVVRNIPYEIATFNVSANATQIGNQKSMISILNAGGSTVKIKILEMFIYNTQTSAVTGVNAEFLFRRFTGHTGGTLLTADANDSADSLDSSVTVRTGATISGEGTINLGRWYWSSDEFGPGAPDAETTEHTSAQLIASYHARPNAKPITLNAGQGIHVRQNTNSTAGNFDLIVVFTQE